jgi:hypothetical protein
MFGADFAVLEARSPSIHAVVARALDERRGHPQAS